MKWILTKKYIESGGKEVPLSFPVGVAHRELVEVRQKWVGRFHHELVENIFF
jgi:hypothetical protein